MNRTIKPKKHLGQNFLVDGRIIRRIVDAVSPRPEDAIVEIGPGEGSLTVPLVERAGLVVALEIDRRLVEHLRERIQKENFLLIEADALQIDWSDLLGQAVESLKRLRPQTDPHVRVVANLPYYISTPVIEKLIKAGRPIEDMTLMLQKEVVERITSRPGSKEYGYLSVLVHLYSKATRLFDVPPSAFRPAPKVWSSIVRLEVRRRPAIDVDDEERFLAVVRAAFAQRRKTVANNLKAAAGALAIDREIEAVFDRAGIDPRRRTETLSLDEFAELYRALYF
ncbi:MAG TPA: 16S rRNA (adenine(1518)-N(6)/adenine(1519)-N(6))-dimethyltransferase RsmA [Blastocatellia bacterium]|nr:16S rRNA (adenine(1518)-N(6)/adenine(1519)-N(6))-dimethyltransferase RsmA [Blastocatellia bacterium]